MTDRLETCGVYRATIPLSLLQISDLCTVPTRFSESLNEKIRCVNYARFPKSGHISGKPRVPIDIKLMFNHVWAQL